MYEKAIVTFLDVLGFRDIVMSSDGDTVNSILGNLITQTAPEREQESGLDPEVITFSDSVVRVRKIDSAANKNHPLGLVFWEILSLAHAQGMLIADGVLVRGGVAFGDISMSGQQVFGPALISAYELESKYAQYPRIVIEPSLFHEMRVNPLFVDPEHRSDTESSLIRDMVCQGDDGLWFIDYARAIRKELDEPEVYPSFLKAHRALIVKRAHQFKRFDPVLAKYLWLAHYHNQLIREITPEFFSHYGIQRRGLLVSLRDLPTLKDKGE